MMDAVEAVEHVPMVLNAIHTVYVHAFHSAVGRNVDLMVAVEYAVFANHLKDVQLMENVFAFHNVRTRNAVLTDAVEVAVCAS